MESKHVPGTWLPLAFRGDDGEEIIFDPQSFMIDFMAVVARHILPRKPLCLDDLPALPDEMLQRGE